MRAEIANELIKSGKMMAIDGVIGKNRTLWEKGSNYYPDYFENLSSQCTSRWRLHEVIKITRGRWKPVKW